jgi:hypothetical protein
MPISAPQLKLARCWCLLADACSVKMPYYNASVMQWKVSI